MWGLASEVRTPLLPSAPQRVTALTRPPPPPPSGHRNDRFFKTPKNPQPGSWAAQVHAARGSVPPRAGGRGDSCGVPGPGPGPLRCPLGPGPLPASGPGRRGLGRRAARLAGRPLAPLAARRDPPTPRPPAAARSAPRRTPSAPARRPPAERRPAAPAPRGSQPLAAAIGRPAEAAGAAARPGGFQGRVAPSSGSDKSISSPGAARYKALGAGGRACARRTCGGSPTTRRVPAASARGPRPERPAAHSKRPRAGRWRRRRPRGRSRAEVPAQRAPAAGEGEPSRAQGSPFWFVPVAGFLSLRLVPRWAGWLLGAPRRPGCRQETCQSAAGGRASAAPAEKSAAPGRARERLPRGWPLLRVSA